jgi:hypothetical protein
MSTYAHDSYGRLGHAPPSFPLRPTYWWDGEPLVVDAPWYGGQYDVGGPHQERMNRQQLRQYVNPPVVQTIRDHPSLGGPWALNVDPRDLDPWILGDPSLYTRFL